MIKGPGASGRILSGPEIRQIIASLPARVDAYEVIPDEEEIIAERLMDYADRKRLDLISDHRRDRAELLGM